MFHRWIAELGSLIRDRFFFLEVLLESLPALIDSFVHSAFINMNTQQIHGIPTYYIHTYIDISAIGEPETPVPSEIIMIPSPLSLPLSIFLFNEAQVMENFRAILSYCEFFLFVTNRFAF